MATTDRKELAVEFVAYTEKFLADLKKLKAQLDLFAKSTETLSKSMAKTGDAGSKSLEGISKAAKDTSKVVGDMSKSLAGGAEKIVKSQESLGKSTDKVTESTKKQTRTYAEAKEQLTGFNAAQIRSMNSSKVSSEMFDAVASKLKKFSGVGSEATTALYNMAKASDNNVYRFKQLSSGFEEFQKYTMAAGKAVESTRLSMNSLGLAGDKWKAGVNESAVATAFMQNQVIKANGSYLEMGKTIYQTGDKIDSLRAKFSNLSTNTFNELKQRLGAGVNSFQEFERVLQKSSDRAKVAQSSIDALGETHRKLGAVAGASTKAIDFYQQAVQKGAITENQAIGALKQHVNNLNLAKAAAGTLADQQTLLSSTYREVLGGIQRTEPALRKLGESAQAAMNKLDGSKVVLGTVNQDMKRLQKTYIDTENGIKNFQTTLAKMGGVTSANAGFVGGLTKKLNEGVISSKEATASLKEHSAAMIKSGENTSRLSQFMAGLHGKLTGTASAAGMASNYFVNLGHAIGSLAAWIPAAMIIGGLTQAISSAISEVVNFEQSLKSLQAISQGTDAEISLLGKEILSISEKTKYSSSEIAKGAIYIAQAGFTAAESLQVVGAAARGAQGTLEPLSVASDLLTTVLRAFHIEAARSSEVIDMLAMAANKSKTDLEGMKTVFNYLGPAAHAAGIKLDETLGVVMALSNVGMKMSTIGTSLRQVFIGLENPSAKLQIRLRDLGMTVDDLSVKKMGGLVPVLVNLDKIIGGSLTNAVQFFNVRAGNAAQVISQMNAHVAMMIKYTNEYGASAIMAGKQTEGMAIQLSILGNHFQNFIIRMTQGGLTSAFKVLVSAANGLISVIEYLVNNPLANFLITSGLIYFSIINLVGILQKLGAVIIGHFIGTMSSAVMVAVKTVGVVNLLTAAWSRWTAALMSNPWGLIIVALSVLAAVILKVIRNTEEQSKALQEGAIIYANNAQAAENYAKTLRKGDISAESHLALLRQIKDTFPQLTKEIVLANGNYEKEALVLDKVVESNRKLNEIYSKNAVAVMIEQYKKLGLETQFYSKELLSNESQLSRWVDIFPNMITLLSTGIGSLLGIESATGRATIAWDKIKLAWNTTSAQTGIDAAEKLSAAMNKQRELYPQVASVIINSSKTIRESLIKSLPEGEMKTMTLNIVAGHDLMVESLKIGADEIKVKQIDNIAEMGQKWIDYYLTLDEAGQAEFAHYALISKKKLDTEMKNFEKQKLGQQANNEERIRLEDEYLTKYVDKINKHAEAVLKAIQKIGSDKEKLYKEQLAVELMYLDVSKNAEIAALKKIDTTKDEYTKRKFEIEDAYYKKSFDLINEETKKRLDSQAKIYAAELAYIEAQDKANKSELRVKAEQDNAEKISAIWKDQLSNYKTHINEMIAKSKEYSDKYLAALAEIAAIEKELTDKKQSLEEKKREALRLTMTEEEKNEDKFYEFNETLEKGYLALAKAERESDSKVKKEKLDTAENYFNKAEGMINSLTKTTFDSDRKARTSLEETKNARVTAANEVEAAFTRMADAAKTLPQAVADANEALFKENEDNIGRIMTSFTNVKTEFDKGIKVAINVDEAISQLKSLMRYIEGGKFEVVIKILGSASPADALDVVIGKVKGMLTAFQTDVNALTKDLQIVVNFKGYGTSEVMEYLSNAYLKAQSGAVWLSQQIQALSNAGIAFMVHFKGYGTSEVMEYLSNAYLKAQSGAVWLSQQIQALSNAGIAFMVHFKGNDGSGESYLSQMISSVYTKMWNLSAMINSLVTVHTITTRYVTEYVTVGGGGGGEGGEGMAEGGEVPGTGDGDTVPAMLTPGEFVIRKSAVQTFGEGFFHMINKMNSFTIPKFNLGGLVPSYNQGGLVNSHEVFTLNLQAGSAKLPLKVAGNPNVMRQQIKMFEKELSRMRLVSG